MASRVSDWAFVREWCHITEQYSRTACAFLKSVVFSSNEHMCNLSHKGRFEGSIAFFAARESDVGYKQPTTFWIRWRGSLLSLHRSFLLQPNRYDHERAKFIIVSVVVVVMVKERRARGSRKEARRRVSTPSEVQGQSWWSSKNTATYRPTPKGSCKCSLSWYSSAFYCISLFHMLFLYCICVDK